MVPYTNYNIVKQR